jgi:hypothetical protein
MTIVATGSSGGGLADFGVFFNEQVYTVYINMRDNADAAAPSWVLQYAVLHTPSAPSILTIQGAPSQRGLAPPFPLVKESPKWPVELVSRYPRRMVVVYAIITTEGKLERMHIMDTPNAEINQPLLEALAKWVFRPAELDGQTVSLKALFGIPLWLSE